MLKRQMCGRARLDLVSRRFVRARREHQTQAPGQGAPALAHAEAKAASPYVLPETGHDGERPEGDVRHAAWGDRP